MFPLAMLETREPLSLAIREKNDLGYIYREVKSYKPYNCLFRQAVFLTIQSIVCLVLCFCFFPKINGDRYFNAKFILLDIS